MPKLKTESFDENLVKFGFSGIFPLPSDFLRRYCLLEEIGQVLNEFMIFINKLKKRGNKAKFIRSEAWRIRVFSLRKYIKPPMRRSCKT